jgi:hypothetical protein
MRPNNSIIVSGGNASTASFVSTVIYATDIVRASFQIFVSSGSANGTIQLQASNQQATGAPANQFIPTQWSVVGSSTTVICSSTATIKTFLLPSTELSYEYLRIVFTDSVAAASPGLVNVRMKSIGL